jgi:nucleoside-diphosphate-sugar epimerase
MALHILLVGCGDLGTQVACLLTSSKHQVTGVRRSEQTDHRFKSMQADVTNPDTLHAIRDLSPDIILYCVAASGQTDAQYKAAYVDGLRHILEAQAHNIKLKHVFFVSSTRVYGQEGSALLDDDTLAIPADFGGERLLEAEQLLNAMPFPTTVLRLSGIYGPGRLRMITLAQAPHAWPQENSWTNRIHRDDAALFIHYLIMQLALNAPMTKLHNTYIVTDSGPVSQFEVINWLAQQLNIDTQCPLQTQDLTKGKRLSNKRMLATGFQLRYPNYQIGYATLLST